MRKSCIDLNYTLKCAHLFSGDLGGGKLLHIVTFSSEPTPKDWQLALDNCLGKADELKYEVSRIRGKSLTELTRDKLKMDVKKDPVYGTHCMMCDHSKNYDEDDRVPESCPVCGEHKEFTILHLDSLQN